MPTNNKVKALLVGINYTGTRNALGGCINDVLNSRAQILAEYPNAEIQVLTDNTIVKPTRDNILENLKKLIDDSKADDILMFHYSGHGSQVRDLDGDEADGMDETICPLDYATPRTVMVNGKQIRLDSQIVDDEINSIIAKTPRKGKFFMLSDSCHSGSIADLKNTLANYAGASWLSDRSLKALKKRGLDKSLTIEGSVNFNFNPFVKLSETFNVHAALKYQYSQKTNTHHHFDQSKGITRLFSINKPECEYGELRTISGCEDNQTSADTGTNGACTKAFWETVKATGGLRKFFPKLFSHNIQDLQSIENAMNTKLALGGFTQHARISMGQAVPATATAPATTRSVAAPAKTSISTHPMVLRSATKLRL